MYVPCYTYIMVNMKNELEELNRDLMAVSQLLSILKEKPEAEIQKQFHSLVINNLKALVAFAENVETKEVRR